jgi:integrase
MPKLLALTIARTNEIVGACWGEFRLDGEDPMWTIPAGRVKNGSDHHVPLTNDMLSLLAALPRAEGESRLFPAYTGNSMLPALKRIEGCDGFTVHGFRSAFKDWCGNETPFARDIVEETYGHDASENAAERAYRRRKAMKKRRMVLEAWNRYVMSAPARVLRAVPAKAA